MNIKYFKILIVLFMSLHVIPVCASNYGTFVWVKGKVFIEDDKSPRTDVKVGTRISEGQTVVTEMDSRAKIVMSDRNVLNILPGTRMKIEKYRAGKDRNVSLNLIEGSVRSDVEQAYDDNKNKFEVKTAVAVAGVRGTQFLVTHNSAEKKTDVHTFDGKVYLVSIAQANTKMNPNVMTKETIVVKGEMAEVSKEGKVKDPVRIPPEKFKELERDTNLGNEEKRDETRRGKGDSENIVGGVNSTPLVPQDTLQKRPVPEVIKPNEGKTKVKVIVN